jgi:hypothetical protein
MQKRGDSPEVEDMSYYDMMRHFRWQLRKKEWEMRMTEAIVQIYPRKWYEALEPDPSKPNKGRNSSTFATAARRALMLYVPFRDISALSDVEHLLDATARIQFLDPAGSARDNEMRWIRCFEYYISHSRNCLPPKLFDLYEGLTDEDFDVAADVDLDSNDEWDPTPEMGRRHEQEWERAARLPLNGQRNMGQPREFFGFRDIDLLHDWNTDFQDYQLPADLETFIARSKQEDPASAVEFPPVLPETLNNGQRAVYDYIIERFTLDNDRDQSNVVVMGCGGAGKSYLIRALENGIWQVAKDRYGEERYPMIPSVVKLAAFTGKAAYQVGGVTIHSLLSVGNIYNPQQLGPENLRRLQTSLADICFLFLDEMSMIGLCLFSVIDSHLREIRPWNHDKPFGGVRILLFGDFGQLPPVLDLALYQPVTPRSPAVIQMASHLYRGSFPKAFELTQQMRQ